MRPILLAALIALGSALTAACQGETAANARERAVYKAVLTAEFPRHLPRRLALTDSTVTPLHLRGWWRLDSLADPTLPAFERVTRQPTSQLHLPIASVYYTHKEIAFLEWSLVGRLVTTVRNGSSYVVSVSPVVYAPDSTQALVYFEYRCLGEGMCGGSTVYVLSEDATNHWQVRHHLMLSAS